MLGLLFLSYILVVYNFCSDFVVVFAGALDIISSMNSLVSALFR